MSGLVDDLRAELAALKARSSAGVVDGGEARHDAVKALQDVMEAVPCSSLYSMAEAVLGAGYSLNPRRAVAVPDGLNISSEDVEHLKHARRELTRMDRAPLYIRQALAEKITAMLAAAPSAQQKEPSDE